MLIIKEVLDELNDLQNQLLSPYVKKNLQAVERKEEDVTQYYICPFCNAPNLKIKRNPHYMKCMCEACSTEARLSDIASKVEGVTLQADTQAEHIAKELELLRDIKARFTEEQTQERATPQETAPQSQTLQKQSEHLQGSPESETLRNQTSPPAEPKTQEQAPATQQEQAPGSSEPQSSEQTQERERGQWSEEQKAEHQQRSHELTVQEVQESMDREFRANDMFNALTELDSVTERITYTPTGFKKLDELLGGGLTPGLITLGAQSSVGKTSLALQIATNIASTGRKVIFFSLEMSKYELLSKIISRYTYTKGNKIAKNALTTQGVYVDSNKKNWSKAQENNFFIVRGELYKSGLLKNIFVFESDTKIFKTKDPDTGKVEEKEKEVPIGVDTVKKKLDKYRTLFIRVLEEKSMVGKTEKKNEPLRQARENGKDYNNGNPVPLSPVVFIDYAQILAPADIRATDKQNIDTAVRELKKLSRDYNTTVFLLSAFNRQSNNKSADMSSFRESSSLEYGSDILLALQPHYVKETEKQSAVKNKEAMEAMKASSEREVELKVLKNRNGKTNVTETLTYIAPFNYFEESPEGFLSCSEDEQAPF